jgi:YHS domain-containing protein
MTVSVTDQAERATYGDVMYYFCGAGCRRRFESNPSQYVTEVKST